MYSRFEYDYSVIGIKTKYLNTHSTGGFIKEEAEDFIVRELGMEYEHKSEGLYTHCLMQKKNWTTIDAVKRLARACHVSWKRVGFAGTKDKKAITTQRISVKDVDIKTLQEVKLKDIDLSDFYYSSQRVNIGDLVGNEFIITVRSHNGKIKKELEEFIKKTSINGIPNFFGEQRFGIQRPNNHIIGKHILREDYEKAMFELLAQTYPLEGEEAGSARNYLKENWGDWKNALLKFPKYLRLELLLMSYLSKHSRDYVNAFRKLPKNLAKIFVYSYQSYLFNLTLSELIKKKLISGFELEIPGYDSKMTSIGSSVMDKIMQEEEVSVKDFRVSSYPEISCRGTKRQTLFFPKNLKVLKMDEKDYTIRFELPSATYATMLLRELIL